MEVHHESQAKKKSKGSQILISIAICWGKFSKCLQTKLEKERTRDINKRESSVWIAIMEFKAVLYETQTNIVVRRTYLERVVETGSSWTRNLKVEILRREAISCRRGSVDRKP